MDTGLLVKITSRAWSIRILALLAKGVPGRQASLLTASGASRTAFGQSLQHLITLGLLERNPGHGHPLRPEYRLTRLGTEVAATAHKITQLFPTDHEVPLLRRAWTLPVLAVSGRPRFFADIKSDLAPITDRALSQSLKQLMAEGWVDRRINATAHPPRPLYQAANDGARIQSLIASTP
ncbi:MAG: winged helix-turn-helix transcriptional regulator [Pseudomonadota bacterium]